MSTDKEMASEENTSGDNDSESGSLRQRKIVKCARDKIEQGCTSFKMSNLC